MAHFLADLYAIIVGATGPDLDPANDRKLLRKIDADRGLRKLPKAEPKPEREPPTMTPEVYRNLIRAMTRKP